MISTWRLALLLSYLSAASVSAAIITPALPIIQEQFGLLQGDVQWVVSVFLMGYVLGQLIYGPLANCWGRVVALQTGLLLNLLGVIGCFFALYCHRYDLLVAGRFISALGTASGLACTFMLINEWLPPSQQKTAMAYAILSFTLGIGGAVVLGGWIAAYYGWAYCFVVLGIQGLLMLLGTYGLQETLKKSQAINVRTILKGYKKALSSMTLVVFAMTVGFCSVIGYCFSAAAPQIANEVLHLSPAAYGYWNLLNMVGMLAGGVGAKILLNRYQAMSLVAYGLSACALAIISLWFMWKLESTSVSWFFFSTMSLYLFSSLVFAGASYIASNALSDKASGAAMMSFINMLSAALAVMLMNGLATTILQSFVGMLTVMWLLVAGLVGLHTWINARWLFSRA